MPSGLIQYDCERMIAEERKRIVRLERTIKRYQHPSVADYRHYLETMLALRKRRLSDLLSVKADDLQR